MKIEDIDNDILLQHSFFRANELKEFDKELQNLFPSSSAREELQRPLHHPIEYVALACKLYSERPALGYRDYDSNSDINNDIKNSDSPYSKTPCFKTINFTQLWSRVVASAAGYHQQGLIKSGDFVGICGFASPDYVIADLTCLYLGAISVPLQTNMSSHDFCFIINETNINCLVCSAEEVGKIIPILEKCPRVQVLVVMDNVKAGQQKSQQISLSIIVTTQQEIEKIGQAITATPMVISSHGSNPLVKLLYTSGSTGTPKGAMFTEHIWLQYFKQVSLRNVLPIPYVGFNYMPLSHLAGQSNIINGIMSGGPTYFTFKSDMSTLFEDIQIVRPTFIMLVPRISSMIYQHYHLTVKMQKQKATATTEINENDENDEYNVTTMVAEEMRRNFLGGRLLYAITTTAPTTPEVLHFLKHCFQIPIINVYGSTEAGGIALDFKINRETIIDYKVVEGELRVKSKLTVSGYYKNPEASKALFDDEGYLKTGDIVEAQGADHIVLIDRQKSILKLAQGEFVSLSRLEGLYEGNSPLIHQIYLYGNSLRAYLLSVIVPDKKALMAIRPLNTLPQEEEEISQILRLELNRTAKEQQLHSYEIPRDFIIEKNPFSPHNGLLTESNKLSRSHLKAKYGQLLEDLYKKIELKQFQNLNDLNDSGEIAQDASTAQKVKNALEITLGLTSISFDSRFVDLGGDSLNAVTLCATIETLCAVSVPVHLILNPNSKLQDIINYVEGALQHESSANHITFASIHGEGAKKIKKEDLSLDKFLSIEELNRARELQDTLSPSSQSILLTGANGFLGRYLTQDLLLNMNPSGKIYAMVRANSDDEAIKRMQEGFSIDCFSKLLSTNRLIILAGDLTKSKFGLNDEIYDRLSHEVDTIVHNGALVNHAFSYAQLFGPNILGTVEVIRFALINRFKKINFISSIGVPLIGCEQKTNILEDIDPRTLCTERPIDSGYAVGYVTSKWAGEVLLRNLNEQYGIPINIFRCGMILADRKKSGEINKTDYFSRLLMGLVYTGIAPQTFYSPSSKSIDNFDGLPIDFMSQSIAKLATHINSRQHDYRTYHVTNPYKEDNISYDVIVDWVISAGYQITRIDDYSNWYQLFNQRLKNLDEKRQKRSPLPIVYQWKYPLQADSEYQLDCKRFQEDMGDKIPHLTEAFIHKCLKDFYFLKLIDPPSRSIEENLMKIVPTETRNELSPRNIL